MVFKYISCIADIFVCTACTAGYNTLFNTKSAVYYFVFKAECNFIAFKLFSAHFFNLVKYILKICVKLIYCVYVAWVERKSNHRLNKRKVNINHAVIICNISRLLIFKVLCSAVCFIPLLSFVVCFPYGGKAGSFGCHNVNAVSVVCA